MLRATFSSCVQRRLLANVWIVLAASMIATALVFLITDELEKVTASAFCLRRYL